MAKRLEILGGAAKEIWTAVGQRDGSGSGSGGGRQPFWLAGVMSAAERARAQLSALHVASTAPTAARTQARLASGPGDGQVHRATLSPEALAASVQEACGFPAGALVSYRGQPGRQYTYQELEGATWVS